MDRVVHTTLALQLALLLKEQLRCLGYSSSFQFALIFGFLNALCCSAISICATESFLQWQSLTDGWIEDVKINISHPTT